MVDKVAFDFVKRLSTSVSLENLRFNNVNIEVG